MGARHAGPRRRGSTWVAGVGALALPLGGVVAAPWTASPAVAATVPATFEAQGPGPIVGGQTEGIRRSDGTAVEEVAGAVHTVVAHPTDPATLWIGTTNGGVWKTANATAARPDWVPLTDQQRSLSIGALDLDPTVASSTVLVAGLGRFSSFNSQGGPRTGLLRTADGGATWTPLGAAQLTGENVSGVASRGATIVVASNSGTLFGGGPGQGGIFRSTDTGATFTRLSGNGTSGLPIQGVFDLVGDPAVNARLYAATQTGLFRSDDTGATWTPAGGTAPSAITGISSVNPGGTNNIELAVTNAGGTNAVFAGVVNAGNLNGLWRSTDQGATWTRLDSPQTTDSGTVNGLQPAGAFKPGSQGGTHFSILADPTDADLVYVGGDRQPGPFPNSLGANDFSGRLFRCDAALAAGSQCTSLTHNGTAGNSAPHADTREMVFDANGDLVETDDGGIYRRTAPRATTGDWFSLNGDLQIAEHLSCDYDNVADLVLCGNQDTGVPEQAAGGGAEWDSVTTADGGFIAVDDPPGATESVRYSSSNRLGTNSFRRRTCTAADVCVNSTPGFNVVNSVPANQQLQSFETSGGNSTLPLYTPLVMNTVDGDRFVVTSNRVYESTDRLDNLTIVNTGLGNDGNGNPARTTRAIAYGGRQSGADAPGVLWYGDNVGRLWLRSGGGGGGSVVPGWTSGNALDIVLDPENWATAYVTDGSRVLRTTDAGQTFTDISGTLATEAPGAQLWSLEVVPVAGTAHYAVLAGSDAGVLMTQTQSLGTWSELGSLPHTNAFDLQYDAVDDVLLVGTQGRGSWLLRDASEAVPTTDLRVSKSDDPDPVKAGEELFYTVTVFNDGPDKAVGVVATDELPDEVIYLSDSAGCTYNALQHRLTCPLPDIPAGGSRSFTIKTLVKPDAVVAEGDGTLAVQNVVSVGTAAVDTDPSNNTDTETTFIQDKADLQVTKMCKPDGPLPAGETGTCTIYVDNLGPSSARDVVLVDTSVSDGEFTFGDITASQGSCDPPAGGVVRCELGALAAASPSAAGRATVTVEVSANEEMDINDVADATSATPDPVTSNNQARDSLNVTAVSDLSLTKAGPATATAGEQATYTLTATNGGPSTAQGVVIQDDLPAGVSVVSVTGSHGATCNAGVPGDPSRPATCSFGTVSPAGGSNTRTMTVTVRVLPATRGALHNDARVGSGTFDNDLSDNLATVVTQVSGSADLSVVKSASPSPVVAGTDLTYTVTVTNGGPSTADDVVVSDPLPAGTSFASGVDGNGTTVCALVQSSTVVCDLGTMQPGETRTLYVTVHVAPSVPAGTQLQNTATVSSSTPDPDGSDNAGSTTTPVTTSAELWLDKAGVRRSGNPSPVVVYSLVVHNDAGCESDAQSTPTPTCGTGGPSDALDVTVTDHLPLDGKKVVVQYVSPQCTYTLSTHTVVCHTARIPAGASVTFVIEVQVAGSVGTITNSASLTPAAATPDPVASNNTDDVTVVVKGSTGKKG